MFSLQSWFHPEPFFRRLKPSLARSWLSYALAALVPTLILTPLALLFVTLFRLPAFVAWLLPALYLANLLLVFAYAALLHGLSRLLGARATYALTFSILARGAVPFLLLSWIPLANLLGLLASGRAIAIGLRARCRMKEDDSLLAVIITGAVLAALAYAAYLAAFLLLFPSLFFPYAFAM